MKRLQSQIMMQSRCGPTLALLKQLIRKLKGLFRAEERERREHSSVFVKRIAMQYIYYSLDDLLQPLTSSA